MKSQVFKSAWNLVRNLGITFSAALTIAWAEIKSDLLQREIVRLEGMAFNRQAVKAVEAKFVIEANKVLALKPCHVNYIQRNANGQIIYNTSGYEKW